MLIPFDIRYNKIDTVLVGLYSSNGILYAVTLIQSQSWSNWYTYTKIVLYLVHKLFHLLKVFAYVV